MTRITSNHPFKIIWAVDPSSESHLQHSALEAIGEFAKGRTVIIDPVYLLGTFLDSTPTQTSGDDLARVQTAIRTKFNRLIGRSAEPGLKRLTVLPGLGISMRHKAGELTDYAKSQGADVIVLATHARKGIKRWFLGSFADALIQRADVPLLIVNPHWKRNSDFRSILFATDFSDESKEAFFKVLTFAEASRLPLTLFHCVSLTITPEKHLLLTDYSDYERALDAELAESQVRATSWAEEGAIRGVTVAVSVNARKTLSVADSVLREQKNHGGIIAMASRSGDTPLHSTGRTARAVIQGATSAVWVIHPASKRVLSRVPNLESPVLGTQKLKTG